MRNTHRLGTLEVIIQRGKFTKSAKAAGQSVQEHAHSVMNNPKASTLQRRRANFAIQAKKWAKKRKKK